MVNVIAAVCVAAAGLRGGQPGAAEPGRTPARGVVEELREFLARPRGERGPVVEQAFASAALSKQEAAEAAELLWADHLAMVRESRRGEWDGKAITIDGKAMKFEVRTFGAPPTPTTPTTPTTPGSASTSPSAAGRSLFISMHGGGSAPAEVNEQQWRNQIKLYTPREGVYIAPRAPTDAWNMWHEAHMDALFDRLIEDAVAFAGVDPDRVYLMGYSAGGDGVYQLAPRMADRFAAAAMMAGHPNDASPLGLRNLPFSIQCGGEDSAFKRNEVSRKWGEKLDALRAADPEGYEHQTIVYEGLGHWMNGKDAQAVDWMLGHTRNPLPRKVVWRQDDVTHARFYWLEVEEKDRKAGAEVRAEVDGQRIKVTTDGVGAVTLLLCDAMIDLDKPITVSLNGADYRVRPARRTIAGVAESLAERADPRLIFPARLTVPPQK